MRTDTSPSLLRVLIVDDNRDTVDSLVQLLELWGFHPLVAYDGPGALEAILAGRPHVVLLDLGLPGMDGYTVAARLRGQAGTERTPLIALSGYGGEEDRRRSTEAGFDHHLLKPCEPEALRQLLDGYGRLLG